MTAKSRSRSRRNSETVGIGEPTSGAEVDTPLEDAGTEDSLDTEGCCATESLDEVVEEIAPFVSGVPRVRGSRLIPP